MNILFQHVPIDRESGFVGPEAAAHGRYVWQLIGLLEKSTGEADVLLLSIAQQPLSIVK